MSADMMQGLSGSSLVSLSFGTLPAMNAAMNLDANPFASQLAMMTGPETATGGMDAAVPTAGTLATGTFALALADVPDESTPSVVGDDAAQAAHVLAEQITEVVVDAEALPENASPTQIIEAVLNGGAARAKGVVETDAETALAASASTEQPEIETHAPRKLRATKLDDVPVASADPAILAAVILPVVTPVAADPDFVPPENGTKRIAANASPVAAATMSAEPVATADSVLLAGPAAQPLLNADASSIAAAQASPGPAIEQNRTSQPAAPDTATPVVPVATSAPVAIATPAQQPAEPTSVATAVPPSSLATSTPTTQPAAPSPDAAPVEVRTEVAAQAAPPAVSAAVSAQASATPPRATVVPTARAVSGVTMQRAVQAAVQAPQPAQALAALFNMTGPAAEPSPIDALAETPAAAIRTESVQPSWVAALNAVTSPAGAPGLQALSVQPGTSAANAVPLDTLAFDARFVANIETQIARVAGGGQMVRMQIMPEHLGRIDIEMLAGPDRDQVRLVTEHDAVRDTLIQSQVRLEQDLRQNGQRPTDVTVELRQQSPGTQGGSAQQQRGQGSAESAASRDTSTRQTGNATSDDATPAPRRQRTNVRYA